MIVWRGLGLVKFCTVLAVPNNKNAEKDVVFNDDKIIKVLCAVSDVTILIMIL